MQSVAWLSILSRLKALDLQYDDTDIIENCAVLPVGERASPNAAVPCPALYIMAPCCTCGCLLSGAA